MLGLFAGATVIDIALGASLVGLLGSVIYASASKNPDDNSITSHKELRDFKGSDGFLISKNVRLSSKFSNEHVFIAGPTGSGKTSRVAKHNVKNLKGCSIICTDPSCDIYMDVDRSDCEIYRFNPLDPNNSIGYNPLTSCKNTYEVRKIIDILLINGMKSESDSESDKWVKMSAPILKAFAIYNYKFKKYNFSDMIMQILTRPIPMLVPHKPGVVNTNSIEYELVMSKDEEVINELKSFMKIQTAPETLACIQNTLNTSLQLFHDTNIKQICGKPSFDIRTFRKKQSILYIQVPESSSTYFSPIVSVLLQQIMDTCRDNPEGYPIRFVLDELCNIGIIPNFDSVLSTIRRYNMGLLGCTQCLAQMRDNYGQLKSEIILENFNTVCALSGLKTSGEYFSKILGLTDKKLDDKLVKGEVITADELRRLKSNEILIISKNKRGVIDTMLEHF